MYSTYNSQPSLDRINAQINELEKMKQQIQQPIQPPTNLTQNFQLAPTNRDVIKYANTMEEVERDVVIGDTPYFSRDMNIVWIKNTKGEIKTYELKEVVIKDEKDLMIESLQLQINEMKGLIENVKSNNESNVTNDDEQLAKPIKSTKSADVSNVSSSSRKST